MFCGTEDDPTHACLLPSLLPCEIVPVLPYDTVLTKVITDFLNEVLHALV